VRAPREPARDEEEQIIGLPSFITGGASIAKDAPKEPAKEPVEREAAPEEAVDAGDGEARLGRRRRRYRSRADRAEGGEEGGTEPVSAEGSDAQQPLFND
jgi:hypothetical protein